MARLMTALILVAAAAPSFAAAEDDIDFDGSGATALPAAISEQRVQNVAQQTNACCKVMSMLLGKQVYSSGDGYTNSLQSYWSQQEQSIQPSCIFIPKSAKDVAAGVFVLTLADKYIKGGCPFAIRGGGHTSWAGSANIQSGVTIDTQGLNQVTLSPDQSSVSIGPGNRWIDVYRTLDVLNLATSGGRVADVGVGGLTLGGGISFFSPRYGLVCDNVLAYEVVLASGKIVTASALSNAELFKALKGGSNNFGIVTKFEMKVFPQGEFWGGFYVSPIDVKDEIYGIFEKFAESEGYDPYASLITSFSYNPSRGGWNIASNIEYTKPIENPPVFQLFTNLPRLASTMRISNLSDFTLELAQSTPSGYRYSMVTATFKNSAEMMSRYFELANATALQISDVQGLLLSLSFQPLPQAVSTPGFATTAGNGNVLGLSLDDGDLVNALLEVQWSNLKDDANIDSLVRRFIADAEEDSRRLGTYHPYLYLNYAAEWQDPIKGYGSQSQHFLAGTSRKYDREGVFQRLVPGGFKLGGTGRGNAK